MEGTIKPYSEKKAMVLYTLKNMALFSFTNWISRTLDISVYKRVTLYLLN